MMSLASMPTCGPACGRPRRGPRPRQRRPSTDRLRMPASSRSCQPGRHPCLPWRVVRPRGRRPARPHRDLRRGSSDPSAARCSPGSAATRRAAANRSASGGAPVSSANSPSCGVNTVGRVRPVSNGAGPSALQARGVDGVAVDHDRQHRVGDHLAGRIDGGLRATEARADDQRRRRRDRSSTT